MVDRTDFAPCPTCGQYSHSIGEGAVHAAHMHFQSMYAHPVRGHPMGHNFDDQTRDHAQVLVATIAGLESRNAELAYWLETAKCDFKAHWGRMNSPAHWTNQAEVLLANHRESLE